MSRADKAQTLRRIDDILRIRIDGAEWWDVREFVREKEREVGSAWFLADTDAPLSDSQIRRYQQRADELIERSHTHSRRKLFRRHLAQRRALYARSVQSGDYRTALAVLRDEADMECLYDPPPAKPPEAIDPLSTTDVVQRLSARLRQIDAASLPAAEAARLTAMLADALLRAVAVDDLDRRVAALEGKAKPPPTPPRPEGKR